MYDSAKIEAMKRRINLWARNMGWAYKHQDGISTVPTWTESGANLTLRHFVDSSNCAFPDMYLTRELDMFWVMEERGEKRPISSGSTTLEAIAPVYESFCQLFGIDPWS